MDQQPLQCHRRSLRTSNRSGSDPAVTGRRTKNRRPWGRRSAAGAAAFVRYRVWPEYRTGGNRVQAFSKDPSANELPKFSISARQIAGFRVMSCGNLIADGS